MTHVSTVRAVTVTLVATLSLLAATTSASAQGYVAPLVGYDFAGDSHCPQIDDCEDKKINFGVALGALNNVVGFEQEFAYAQDFFGEAPGLSSSVLTVMSNFMIAPNLDVTRPYFLAGLGLIKTKVELTPSSVLQSDNNHFGWNIGGGLMIFPSKHVGVRGDIRYFHAFQELEVLGLSIDGTKLDFGRAAASIIFKF